MITTYESFEELGRAMTDGEGKLHTFNCVYGNKDVSQDACFAWQQGVLDFAAWLDHLGLKVTLPDKSENFYDFMRKKG